ncbi:hypothetical protein INT47_002345 [Mucor saturninus]|uniref:Uncharacterized protein n=1 Tax=Mucor saturninus TaxID=64648 RepID=A0A8H7UQC9_9FUNG|nr:hypothetical protein INT47_002345 [Mucor saturninus]
MVAVHPISNNTNQKFQDSYKYLVSQQRRPSSKTANKFTTGKNAIINVLRNGYNKEVVSLIAATFDKMRI